MIVNNLTKEEFETLIKIILESSKKNDSLKKDISQLLHLQNSKFFSDKQYLLNSLTTGIKNHYRNFEIEFYRINDPQNGYPGTTVVFRKDKKIFDNFISPLKSIFSLIKSTCESEIDNCSIQEFNPGGISPEAIKDHFFIHQAAINPEWKETDKLSSLIIYTYEDTEKYLIEFSFQSECYRKKNKLFLKEDWLDFLSIY